MPKKQKESKRFVALCFYEHGHPDPDVYIGTYEEVLKRAGKYWEDSDLNFDINRKDCFYVDPASGYSNECDITYDKKGRITHVSHACGDGRSIRIKEED